MGGIIGEVNLLLHIGRRSGIDRVLLRALVGDCAHVLGGGAPQDQRIDLLKCQIAGPTFFLLIPLAVEAQVELIHRKMYVGPVGRDLI